MQQLAQVAEVLLTDALLVVQAEQDGQRVDGLGVDLALVSAISESTGSPGVRRGMKKLMVTAAQAVKM